MLCRPGRQASKQTSKQQKNNAYMYLLQGVFPPFLCFSISFLARVSKSISGRAKKYKYLPYLTLPYAVGIVCGYVPYVCTYKAGEKGDERAVVWCGVVGSTYLDLPTLGTLHVLNSLTYM